MNNLTEITDNIKEQLKDPEVQKRLNDLANKFYFYSLGRPVSISFLVEKTKFNKDFVESALFALVATNQAIGNTGSDGVLRFQITGDKDIHLKVLNEEKNFLQERLEWVEKKIQEFS